jgi:hypothetical protein
VLTSKKTLQKNVITKVDAAAMPTGPLRALVIANNVSRAPNGRPYAAQNGIDLPVGRLV